MALVSTRPSAPAPRGSVLRAIWTAFQVKRQRARLAQLDDAMLKDIGLTRANVEEEIRRSPWDAPQHWRA